MDMPETAPGTDILIQLTSDIVSSYVANHNVPADGLPALIQSTYQALKAPAQALEAAEPVRKEPAPVPSASRSTRTASSSFAWRTASSSNP